MSALQDARGVPSRSRLLRVAQTTLLFTLVAPLIGASMLFIESIAVGYSNPRYAGVVSNWPDTLKQSLLMSLQVGAPYAFAVGFVFGLLAEFARARQLWWALGVALLPLTFAHWLVPALGDPIWTWGPFWFAHVVAYIVVPTALCWMVWRRWVERAR